MIDQHRSCTSKVRYFTAAEAADQINFLSLEKALDKPLRVYQCPYCTGFHLTSRPNQRDGGRTL